MCCFIAGAILVLVIVIGVIVALTLRPPETPSQKKKVICITPDCWNFKHQLIDLLNESISPCDNFSAFACSAWQPNKKYADFLTSTLVELVLNWAQFFQEIFIKEPLNFTIYQKALKMFKACMSVGDTISSKRLFKFMESRNISWLVKPPPQANSLDILVDLAVNWNMPLWFRITFLRKTNALPRRILITPGTFAVFRLKHYNFVRNRYKEYWSLYFNAFNPNNVSKPNDTELDKISDMQRTIYEMLVFATTRKRKTPDHFPLKNIGTYTQNIPSGEWQRALNNNLRPNPSISGDDLVLASDTALLETIDWIFGNYTREELLEHLGWSFIRASGYLVDRKYLRYEFGDETTTTTYMPYICLREIELEYGLLLVSLYTTSKFSDIDRVVIEARMSKVQQAISIKTQSMSWLEEEAKRLIVKKVGEIETVLWPSDTFLKTDGLLEVYRDFPSDEDSLIDYWIRGRENITALRERPFYEELTRLPKNYAEPYVTYNYLLNLVEVSVGSFANPLFYKNSPVALFYGGFGFLYARELVKSFDRRGIAVSDKEDRTSSWLPSTSRASMEEKFSCGRLYDEGIFPDIPALEVAFSSFQESLEESNNTNIKTTEKYSEEQVFFIILCFMTCHRPGNENPFAADCNKAMQNFLPFSIAFDCKMGSKMNPEQKCHYFD